MIMIFVVPSNSDFRPQQGRQSDLEVVFHPDKPGAGSGKAQYEPQSGNPFWHNQIISDRPYN
jgi:hypothetical protein